MGIKHLNRFLRDNCTTKSLRKVHLKSLSGKRVVIDTSIYLYKFLGENALFENMYLFISILKYYHITPIFVFDGKPPPEKRDILLQRRVAKKDAKEKFALLQIELEGGVFGEEEKKDLLLEMDALKRQFLRVRDEDILSVKSLMSAYGVSYYDAPAEADQLCVFFVKEGKADICFSDDMDMFLYGCPFVGRNLSLLNHTIILYDTQKILKDVNMSYTNFCEIMILSGTDYDIHCQTSLTETIKWFREYKKYEENCKKKGDPPYGFYVWLFKYTKYIKDFHKLLRTYQMFQLTSFSELESWREVQVEDGTYDEKQLKVIMEKEGFVFA